MMLRFVCLVVWVLVVTAFQLSAVKIPVLKREFETMMIRPLFLHHPRQNASPVYGSALLLLLAACNGSGSSEPSQTSIVLFPPPKENLDGLDNSDTAFVFTSPGAGTLTEGTKYKAGQAVYKAAVKKGVGALVYSLRQDGAELFKIDSASGEVFFKKTIKPDYESGKTSYEFTIVATLNDAVEGRKLKAEHNVILRVKNINEQPEFTSGVSGTLLNNGVYTDDVVVYEAIATPDIAGHKVVYSIKGDGSKDDAELFTINQASGEVKFSQETTTNMDTKTNGYRFTVIATVTSGGQTQSAEQEITLRVVPGIDLNDNVGVYLLRNPDGQTHPDGQVHAIDANEDSDAISVALKRAGIRTIRSPEADATTVFAGDVVKHYPTGVLNPKTIPAVRDDGKKIWAVFTGADDKTGMEGNHIINLFLARAEENTYASGANAADNILSYAYAPTSVRVDLSERTQVDLHDSGDESWAHDDAIKDIDHIVGTDYVDALFGDENNNILEGRDKGDRIYGRGGSDTASYASSPESVTINLLSKTYSGGHADGDTLDSIENLTGSAHPDRLTGDDEDNIIDGGAGADIIDGKGGIDTVSYAKSIGRGIWANLTQGVGRHEDAEGDRLFNVENLIGSNMPNWGDLLQGNAGKNVIRGGDGGDVIIGWDGDDVLWGDAGKDDLRGGAHNDILYGGSESDVIWGDGDNDVLWGETGNDELYGSWGDDKLYGGEGNDFLHAGSGTNEMTGGAGADKFLWSIYSSSSIITDFNPAEGDRIVFRTEKGDETSLREIVYDGNDYGLRITKKGDHAYIVDGYWDRRGDKVYTIIHDAADLGLANANNFDLYFEVETL